MRDFCEKKRASKGTKRYLIQKKKQLTERFDCATRWPLIDPFAVKENGFVSININLVKGT
jgi:hypothetical protein